MAERQTYFETLYELKDITAEDDATINVGNLKSFSDPSLLQDADHESPEDGTLEHNYFVLDGSFPEWRNNPTEISFFSQNKSNASGGWSNSAPYIDITFNTVHSSYGITLGFVNECVDEVKVTWMHDSVVLVTRRFALSGKDCFINQGVDNYNHIIVEFTKVVPDRYVKLNWIYFGARFLWTEDVVKKATMVKEVDAMAERLPIDTLNFELIDSNLHLLNIANPTGMYRYFQKNQPLYAYEWVDGERIPLGKFYFDKYSHEGNVGKLSCNSYLGVLDGIQFNEGRVYNGDLAGTVLEEIFAVAGITDYSIDPATYNTHVYGTLSSQSCRSAIRQVLFACHSIIDTSISDTVIVRKLSEAIRQIISRTYKFSTKVESMDYVSGVKLKFPKYTLANTTNVVDNVTYTTGTYQVFFSTPVKPDTITFSSLSGISNVVKKTYYVKFTCSTTVTITVTAQQYEVEECVVVTNREQIDAGEFQNIKEFNLELCDYNSVEQISQDLLNYYKKNFQITVKFLSRKEDMQDIYERRIVENSFADMDNYIGNYISRSFDLTGGFTESSKLVGTYVTHDREYFADDELITDDDIII